MSAPDQAMLGMVRGFVEGHMNAQVRILRGTRGTFDKTTGLVTGLAGGHVVYLGPARIRDVTGSVMVEGLGPLATASTTISYPIAAAPPRRDDLVIVLDSEDLDLVTRTLHVDTVTTSAFWADAHRMSCSTIVESSRWGQ